MIAARTLLLFAALLPAQKNPDVCPWCKNDPDKMAKAGLVSHGPIAVGPHGSEALVRDLPAGQWLFAETAHLRWASALGSWPSSTGCARCCPTSPRSRRSSTPGCGCTCWR
jgi:hypothetical protein